ncbi:hypothetical protein AX16_005885 [Volvariella volvacea WC 439]|nr:hypothetical protein AX16_005885 [Volvariella volvacea WC 439]
MTDYANRSQSRGRDGFTSSGRGGLGNIRQTSVSRTRPDSGPDDFSSSRGREHAVDPTRVYSTGRGGAGNIRSPSRDVRSPPLGPDIHEQEVVENYLSTHRDTPHSTGRGGLGNMTSRSQSRGPSTPGVVHSTGRGGAGNIVPGDAAHAEVADEAERRKISGVYDREGV